MNEDNGWIKLYRCTLDNPVVMKDADHLAIWTYLLLEATHTERDIVFNGKRETLKAGELVTGRKAIAERLSINEYKVMRVINAFKNEHQIAQRTDHQCSVISILNWGSYQESAQGNAQRLHNDCTTTAHTQECKNVRMKDINNSSAEELCRPADDKSPFTESVKQVVAYLNEKLGAKYKPSTKSTKTHIEARLRDGYKFEDFKKVIDYKYNDWYGTEMQKYLAPDTLFGSKFEKYLNSPIEPKRITKVGYGGQKYIVDDNNPILKTIRGGN